MLKKREIIIAITSLISLILIGISLFFIDKEFLIIGVICFILVLISFILTCHKILKKR